MNSHYFNLNPVIAGFFYVYKKNDYYQLIIKKK